MRVILHLDEDRPEDDAVLGRELGAADVGAGPADRLADVRIEAAAVLAAHREPDLERLPLHFVPIDLHPPFRLCREREEVRAVGAVDGDASPLGDVADDGISGHRLAALRIPDHESLDAMNLDATAQPQPLDDAPQRPRFCGGRLVLLARQRWVERLHHLTELYVTPSDGRFDLLRDAERECVSRLRQLLVRWRVAD